MPKSERDQLIQALHFVLAALNQPVQTSGIESPETCRILRGDALSAKEWARQTLVAVGEIN
jgi:hypothetical protein